MQYSWTELGNGLTHIKLEYTGHVPEWFKNIEKDLLSFLFKLYEESLKDKT